MSVEVEVAYHLNTGLVTVVAVAVKVAVKPLHIDASLAVISEPVEYGFTVIVIVLLVTVVVDAQGSLDVITQVTSSPLASVDDVYVFVLVPTLLPFTFH